MNTLARRIATLVAALALAATATGCTNTPTATPTANIADSQAALDALNNAREITATKSLLSWGDEWGIEADGNKVGTVTGQALYAIGDVYSLVTTSGNLVASESENFQPITHAATGLRQPDSNRRTRLTNSRPRLLEPKRAARLLQSHRRTLNNAIGNHDITVIAPNGERTGTRAAMSVHLTIAHDITVARQRGRFNAIRIVHRHRVHILTPRERPLNIFNQRIRNEEIVNQEHSNNKRNHAHHKPTQLLAFRQRLTLIRKLAHGDDNRRNHPPLTPVYHHSEGNARSTRARTPPPHPNPQHDPPYSRTLAAASSAPISPLLPVNRSA